MVSIYIIHNIHELQIGSIKNQYQALTSGTLIYYDFLLFYVMFHLSKQQILLCFLSRIALVIQPDKVTF